MNLFDKFMFAKQISFTDGQITLLGQPIALLPVKLISLYTQSIIDDQVELNKFYYASKDSVKADFGITVGKLYGFSFKDFTRWFVDMANLAGWGRLHFEAIEQQGHRGVIVSENCPVGSMLKGVVSKPCDHFLRGMMAGGASSAFRENVDFIETECVAVEDPKCRFLMGSRAELGAKFPDIVKEQLGLLR